MNMWKPFINCVTKILPNADISHDNFHISKYLNKSVDAVRKEEVKKNEKLKHIKYVFLKNNKKWTENQKIKFEVFAKHRIRLARIDTPEMHHTIAYRKRQASHAKAVAKKFYPEGSQVIITTQKQNLDHYARYIAEVLFNDQNLSDYLLQKGVAKNLF